MSAKHTPGPWCLSKESMTIITQDMSCIGSEGVLIGSASGHPNSGFFPTDEEAVANARLIAAAPDLLAALQEIAEGTYDKWTNGYHAQQVAITAIAKATGGAQ